MAGHVRGPGVAGLPVPSGVVTPAGRKVVGDVEHPASSPPVMSRPVLSMPLMSRPLGRRVLSLCGQAPGEQVLLAARADAAVG